MIIVTVILMAVTVAVAVIIVAGIGGFFDRRCTLAKLGGPGAVAQLAGPADNPFV